MAEKQYSNENWEDVSKLEVESDTKLEEDVGKGTPVVIRCFEFKANKTAFKQHKPTKQELFTYHQKGIEIQLWADGLIATPAIEPKIKISKKGDKYLIFVGAIPRHGQTVIEQPKTLAELAHNK